MPRPVLVLAVLLAPATTSAQIADSAARMARVTHSLAQAVEVEGRTPPRWSLADRMARYKVPGVSIAVLDGRRVTWAKGFGVVEAGTRKPITPTTLFQAASISKPVTATAMLRLVEQGKLALDTNVNRYLVSWKLPENRFTQHQKVTLRRIVSHSAGLTIHGFPGYQPGQPIPTVPQILNGEKPANTAPVRVDTFPGAIGRYSGGGVTIEQLVLTDVTRRPFPDIMRDVLVLTGMTHSTYEQPLPAARAGEAAHAHGRDGRVIAGGWHVYPEMAAAGLWTTPTDLLHWTQAIDAARMGMPGAILSKAMATQMLTRQKDDFGLGPAITGTGRTFTYGHGGSNEGFHSELVYFPATGQGAAIMTNGDGGPPLMQEILRALAVEYKWPALGPNRIPAVAVPVAALDGLIGDYTVHFGSDSLGASIKRDGPRILITAPPVLDGEELIPESATSFVTSSSGFHLRPRRGAGARATGFVIATPGGDSATAIRKR